MSSSPVGSSSTSITRTEEIEYAPPVLEVTGPLGHPDGGLTVEDYKFTRALTDRTVKVCIPSPTYMYARGGWAGINKDLYPDKDALIAGLAEVYNAELHALWQAGCDFVQIDDTNFAHMCDPKFHDRYRRIGEDPETLPAFYARAINACIRDRPAGQRIGLHMCRGNVRGAWVAEGGYEPVAEALLNELEVDALFMEYDAPRAGDFTPLRHFERDDKLVVLGLITTKQPGARTEGRSQASHRRGRPLCPHGPARAEPPMRVRQHLSGQPDQRGGTKWRSFASSSMWRARSGATTRACPFELEARRIASPWRVPRYGAGAPTRDEEIFCLKSNLPSP